MAGEDKKDFNAMMNDNNYVKNYENVLFTL